MKEKEFWIMLANDVYYFCKNNREVKVAADSISLLYALTGKDYSPALLEAPCYIGKGGFVKEIPGKSEVYNFENIFLQII